MQKILINTYGEAFKAKKYQGDALKQKVFVWKNNVYKHNKLALKQEFQNRKANSRKSVKTKLNFTKWKKIDYYLQKQFLKIDKKIKICLLKKGCADLDIIDDRIHFRFYNSDLEAKFIKLKADHFQAWQKLIPSDHGNLATRTKMVVILNHYFNYKRPKIKSAFQEFIHKIKQVKKVQSQAQAQAKVLKRKTQKSQVLIKFLKQIIKNKNYNWFSWKGRWQLKYDFYSLKRSLLGPSLTTYQDFYIRDVCDQKINFYKKFDLLKTKYQDKLATLRQQLKAIKPNQKQRKYEKKIVINALQILKKEIKDEKENIKIKLKSNNSSRQAKKIELLKLRNKYQISKLKILNQFSSFYSCKRKIKSLQNLFKNEVKHLKKTNMTILDDILKKHPIEISNLEYWSLITIGSVFPMLTSLYKKQYAKFIFHCLFLVGFAFIIAWSFGAFPSHNGNGLIGLFKLGHNPQTQIISDSIIGLTNGKPNDSRFFLVTGVIASILTIVATFGYVLIVLNNINQCNLMRLGVRTTKFWQQKNILKNEGLPYLISLPAFIFIIFIVIVPLVATILISLTNINDKVIWDPINKFWIRADGIGYPISWVGTKQFSYIFRKIGPEFVGVLRWTLLWTFGSTIVVIFLGTLFAILVNQKRIKGKTLIRVIYILPWSIPSFITIMFFSIFFEPTGIFNTVIGNKIFTPNTNFLNDGAKTKALMIILQGWLGHSYIFLLITGTLQSIPRSLYESARVDGASAWRQFKTITLPMITASVAPLLIGQFTFAFNNFGLIYLLNEGGNVASGKTAGQFDIFISWIYRLITSGTDSNPGAAAAISLVTSVFTITPSLFLFLRSKSFRKGNF